jgi:hypothetical protein
MENNPGYVAGVITGVILGGIVLGGGGLFAGYWYAVATRARTDYRGAKSAVGSLRKTFVGAFVKAGGAAIGVVLLLIGIGLARSAG